MQRNQSETRHLSKNKQITQIYHHFPMKKNLLSLVLSLMVCAFASAQTAHTVIVTNYQFVPAILNVSVGDTINFICTLGCHDVNGTQATFPTNPASFGNSTACATWDYTFIIPAAGTYQYQSDADIASGMQGSIIAVPAVVPAGPFTPGNIVVARIGDGVLGLNTAAQPVFLEEYSYNSSGGLALVQTITMPTSASGNNAPFGVSGNSTSEAGLQNTTDGTKLLMPGYAVTPTTANTQTFGSSNRVIAVISANGTIDTQSGITTGTGYTNMSIRSAASIDGTAFWCSGGTGGGGGTGASGGTRYLAAGSVTSSSVQMSTTAINTRGVGIANGQLYAAGTLNGVSTLYTVGTGLPTTATQTTTVVPGFPTTAGGAGAAPTYAGFHFLNMSDTVANNDVLYIVDGRSAQAGGGVQKWSKVGGIWKQNSRITVGTGTVANITVRKVCDKVYITGTTTTEIVGVIDSAGYNQKPSDSTFASLVTAATNTAFRGIALSPNTIQSSAPLALTPATTDATCGQTDGSAVVTVTGGAGSTYTYIWNNTQTTNNISAVGVGTYTVTISDILGCTKSASTIVSAQATSAPLTETLVNPTCHGTSTGSANVVLTTPTSTYTYLWSNGATTATANNLMAGTYTVTISDANGCIQRDTVTLTDVPAISLGLFPTPAIGGFGVSNGAVTTTIAGGVPPYQYIWTGGATTQNLTNIPAGSYVVSISDANGCTASAITTVVQLTGTNDIANLTSFTAYPNPTNGHYFINIDLQASETVSIQVYDINGRLLTERRNTNSKNSFDLDLSAQAPGVYSAKIMVGNTLLQVIKVVKI